MRSEGGRDAAAREEPIGRIIHYWPKAGSAQVELHEAVLKVGDKLHIKGHGHEFIQVVESLEIDHRAKSEGWPGEHVANAVMEPVRENDEVFRIRERA